MLGFLIKFGDQAFQVFPRGVKIGQLSLDKGQPFFFFVKLFDRQQIDRFKVAQALFAGLDLPPGLVNAFNFVRQVLQIFQAKIIFQGQALPDRVHFAFQLGQGDFQAGFLVLFIAFDLIFLPDLFFKFGDLVGQSFFGRSFLGQQIQRILLCPGFLDLIVQIGQLDLMRLQGKFNFSLLLGQPLGLFLEHFQFKLVGFFFFN